MSGPAYHGRTHLEGGTDPIAGLVHAPSISTFFDAVMALAETGDLRGYWRLGEGGLGPYADSKPDFITWANAPMERVNVTVDMTDIDTGALSAGDDGAVQFNASDGIDSDYLQAPNTWGAGGLNPFEASLSAGLTVAGWVKPVASASDFDGAIFSMLTSPAGLNGYALGVAWPTRTVFFETFSTRLTSSILPADEWTFVVAVADNTSNRIYLNGALVTTGTAIDPAPTTNISPKIGFWMHSDNETLYGAVDEVSVWGAALTADEIATLYTAGVGGVEAGGVPIWDGEGGVTWGQIGSDTIEDGTIVNADVSDTAAIEVSKLEDGWAAGAVSPDNTHAWMPLTTVSAGVPDLVWDGDDQLIPTLTSI